MNRDRLRKIFGVGPVGAALSLLLLAVALLVDHRLGSPPILPCRSFLTGLGVLLVLAGLGLHFRSMHALSSWWAEDRLCTRGPFRWFRHPMYAAWITFVSLGVALCLDSWVALLWVVALHAMWRGLVTHEEKMMARHFPDEYPPYAARTGRFIPRLRRG
jgi:protein-S-isoprenylcysteine O-methyltransferase Ste14